jgi:predicted Zn-dependent protease
MRRTVLERGMLPIIIVSLLAITGCARTRKPEYVPLDKTTLHGFGRIYFVPFGDFPAGTTQNLVDYYQTKYGLIIDTLPAVQFEPSAINPERNQVIAEAAVNLMKRANPNLAETPDAILIGLTNKDMYIAQYDWQFTFSWREEGQYAVVSNERMNLGSPSAEKQESRLRKMVTKNIGMLYYHLPQSNNPQSVLYQNVGGISELDYMGEEF